MAPVPPPIRINRAPVLIVWATVVAERLGYLRMIERDPGAVHRTLDA
jgi:hypothetical protein